MRRRTDDTEPEKFITAEIVNAKWPRDQAGTQEKRSKDRTRGRKTEHAAARNTLIGYPDALKEPATNSGREKVQFYAGILLIADSSAHRTANRRD